MGGSVDQRPGSGWAAFAGVFLILAGAVNLIWGIAALAKKSHFHESGLLFSNLRFWGGRDGGSSSSSTCRSWP